jgi:hypothetical protein
MIELGKEENKIELCWYCRLKERKSENDLFCEDCSKLKQRDKQSGTYIIYDKI